MSMTKTLRTGTPNPKAPTMTSERLPADGRIAQLNAVSSRRFVDPETLPWGTMRPGAVLVDCSTVSPATSKKFSWPIRQDNRCRGCGAPGHPD